MTLIMQNERPADVRVDGFLRPFWPDVLERSPSIYLYWP